MLSIERASAINIARGSHPRLAKPYGCKSPCSVSGPAFLIHMTGLHRDAREATHMQKLVEAAADLLVLA